MSRRGYRITNGTVAGLFVVLFTVIGLPMVLWGLWSAADKLEYLERVLPPFLGPLALFIVPALGMMWIDERNRRRDREKD